MQQELLQKTKALCRKLDIVPTKSKGQNFLVSQEILDKIMATANLGKDEVVLEIGPGLGILTQELIQKAGKVVAVELDKRLFGWLKGEFKQAKNLELMEGDIVKLLNYQMAKLLEGKKYKVVANLPYQITSHILRLLLELVNPPTEMVLMVQKEVGERICAAKGEMSILSVMVQYYSQPVIVAVVGKDNFWPIPEVDSVIIKLKTPSNTAGRQNSPASPSEAERAKLKSKEDLFFKLVKVGFSGKRKMLKNNLRNVYQEEEVLMALDELVLNFKVRAEDLGVEEWIQLYKKLGR